MQTQLSNKTEMSFQISNSHHFFAAYLMPPILLVGFLENGFTMVILLSLRAGNGMGHTTRFLFIALTISDLLNLVFHYGLNMFGTYGLKTLTSGSFSLSFNIGPTGNIACRALRTVSFCTLHCLNWIYVLINVQRIMAVRCPHRARRYLSICNARLILLFVSAFGVACGLMFGASFHVQQDLKAGLGSENLCVTDTGRRAVAIVARLLFDIDVLTGTNVLSLILAVLIFLRIRKQIHWRRFRRGEQRRRQRVVRSLDCQFTCNSRAINDEF